MNYSTLITRADNGILTIIINRPEKLNAINSQVMADLNLVVDEVQSNSQIRSAIITGSGNKAFVAGADIAEFMGSVEGMALSKKGQDIFLR